jgi:hypothetical protein
MGELPSQQPPDWWNISGPCFAASFSISAVAAAVQMTWAGASLTEAPAGLASMWVSSFI